MMPKGRRNIRSYLHSSFIRSKRSSRVISNRAQENNTKRFSQIRLNHLHLVSMIHARRSSWNLLEILILMVSMIPQWRRKRGRSICIEGQIRFVITWRKLLQLVEECGLVELPGRTKMKVLPIQKEEAWWWQFRLQEIPHCYLKNRQDLLVHHWEQSVLNSNNLYPMQIIAKNPHHHLTVVNQQLQIQKGDSNMLQKLVVVHSLTILALKQIIIMLSQEEKGYKVHSFLSNQIPMFSLRRLPVGELHQLAVTENECLLTMKIS